MKRDKEWIRARDAQLADEPYCLICGSTYGLVVHHIETCGMGIKDNSPENLVSLCFHHHTGAEGVHTLGKQTFNRMFNSPFEREEDNETE